MERRKLSVIIIIIVTNLISIFVAYNLKNFLTKSQNIDYSTFVTLSNQYIEKLSEKYVNTYISSPTVTVYPGYGELNKYWTDSVYNAIDDDLAFLKQKSIYILNDEKNIISKVVFNYAPSIHQKSYLSVNRIFSSPIDSKNMKLSLASTFSNSITTNGMFIQVTTIELAESTPNREFEKKMISMNTDITSKIQEFIIETTDL